MDACAFTLAQITPCVLSTGIRYASTCRVWRTFSWESPQYRWRFTNLDLSYYNNFELACGDFKAMVCEGDYRSIPDRIRGRCCL